MTNEVYNHIKENKFLLKRFGLYATIYFSSISEKNTSYQNKYAICKLNLI